MPLVVVTGPPCSGKTTHVRENAGPLDVVIDLDAIAHALGYPAEQIDYTERPQHPARNAAMTARASVIKTVLAIPPTGHTVWIIDSLVTGTAMHRYRRARAKFVALDPGERECRDRAIAADRPAATLEQIARWYHRDTVATSTEW